MEPSDAARSSLRWLASALLLILPLALAPAGSAQVVRGVAVEAHGGTPLEGVFVSLVDATGSAVRSALTEPGGAFALEDVRSGTYHLRVARTGIETWTSDPFRVADDEAADRRLEVPVRRESLGALQERARRACRASGGAGDAGPPGAILFGQVRDADTGAGVAEAQVWLLGAGEPRPFHAGEEGGFLVCGLPSDTPLEVQASAPGRLGETVEVTLPAGQVVIRDFVVSRAALARSEGGRTATLRGRVLSAETGRPVRGVGVEVLEVGEQRTTTPDGAFIIEGLPRRELRVVTRLLGSSSDTATVDLADGNVTVALFTLQTDPVALPALHVGIERTLRNTRLTGYYERLDRRLGDFITHEDLQRSDIIDNFRRLPGVSVQQCTGEASFRETDCWEVDLERGYGLDTACPPLLFVNGQRLTAFFGGAALEQNPFDLLESFDRDQIEGIEVYRNAAQAPAAYNLMGSACGVILVWTTGL